MITPVNGHIIIDPVKHETFVASSKEKFEEVGIVVALPNEYIDSHLTTTITYSGGTGYVREIVTPKVGDKVYFDSWLAAKYPKNETEFFWLVKWEDVRAVERNEQPNGH